MAEGLQNESSSVAQKWLTLRREDDFVNTGRTCRLLQKQHRGESTGVFGPIDALSQRQGKEASRAEQV